MSTLVRWTKETQSLMGALQKLRMFLNEKAETATVRENAAPVKVLADSGEHNVRQGDLKNKS